MPACALYALSNWSARDVPGRRSERYPFLAWFRGVVDVGRESVRAKPEPAVSEALVERYGVVPGESVFIDDQPANVDGGAARSGSGRSGSPTRRP